MKKHTEEELKNISDKNISDKKICITQTDYLSLLIRFDAPMEPISLFLFYTFETLRTGSNVIKTNTKETAERINWSVAKVIKWKKELLIEGLIRNVSKRNEKGKLCGSYIQIYPYFNE